MNFSDIASERYKSLNNNDNDIDNFKSKAKRENRTDDQNEALATRLMEKLGASEWKPFLAVAYSGIPQGTIDRHLATAQELGRNPAKLFMHMITREALWVEYQKRKSARLEGEAS